VLVEAPANLLLAVPEHGCEALAVVVMSVRFAKQTNNVKMKSF
jgi:hypothetical protein